MSSPVVELRFVIHEFIQYGKPLYRRPEGQLQYRYHIDEMDGDAMTEWADVPTVTHTVILAPSKTGGG